MRDVRDNGFLVGDPFELEARLLGKTAFTDGSCFVTTDS